MKKRTLLICLALTSVLSLSSTAYASEVSVQGLIDGASSQTEADSQTDTETPQAETETASTQNTNGTNTVSSQTESSDPSNTDSQESDEASSDGQVVPGTSMYDAGFIPFNTKVSGTATESAYNWYTFTTGSTAGTEYKITCVNTSQGANWDGVEFTLYDEFGDAITSGRASTNGTPATISTSELNPATAYYIQLTVSGFEDFDYVLTVHDPSAPVPTQTPDTQNTLSEGENVVPGSSQTDALLLPLNTKVFGNVEGGSYSWFAFHTGDTAGDEYRITCVNATPGPNWGGVEFLILDEYGSAITSGNASTSGSPSTIVTTELAPGTTYYIRMKQTNGDDSEYSLVVKNMNDQNTAYKTAGNVIEAKGAEEITEGAVTAGTCPDNAPLLPVGASVSSTARANYYSWFGFTTDENSGTEYKLTCVNNSQGADWNGVDFVLYDQYGNVIASGSAPTDGTPSTISTSELNPDTTYYIQLSVDGFEDFDYTLRIQAPVKEDPKDSLVFEVPFEINETQVQFVINEATFIDEEKAKEALKPVADAILAHPDHSILLAGTTATDGTQESCVDLANRRCEAVKNLLVDTYSVPESQLETIGLGYELDPFERGQDRDANGNFVESEGRKNRRVVVLDIEDPIAQELLKLK